MLTVLRHLIQEIVSAPNFFEALQMAVKRIAAILTSEACCIFLLDHYHNCYLLIATHGYDEALTKMRVPLHKGLIGLIGDRQAPLSLVNADDHANVLPLFDEQVEQYHAFLGVPLVYHGQLIGVIAVQRLLATAYDESEEAFLVTLSVQLGAMVAQALSSGALADYLPTKWQWDKWIYSGTSSVPGVSIGMGVVISEAYDLDTIPDRGCDDVEAEIILLDTALEAVQKDLCVLSERLSPMLSQEERALFEAYQRILSHADLGSDIARAIRQGNWASGALCKVIKEYVSRLERLENDYMRERAIDIKDLGRRILAHLQKKDEICRHYYDKTILLGYTLSATDLAEVPAGKLVGVIAMTGSANSHVAILARALNIPTVMGAQDIPLYELQHQEIIVDGYSGKIYVAPSPFLRAEFERLIAEETVLEAEMDQLYHKPAMTQDGHRISMLVNAGLNADIGMALSVGADGVGLYRTEVPFLVRDRFPSGEEQRVIYRQLLSSFTPRPVIIRTLDVGGDKSLPYFPIKEDNPFLGWRGIRITLDHPEIFLLQMRAMLRASERLHNLRIIFPMVTEVREILAAKQLLQRAYTDVCQEGYDIIMPPVGAMIEVPAAVYQARDIARQVDFLSVGSNDLTQYLLAVDRNNPRVAGLYDALHPAVLRALLQTVASGHEEGKHVSICGKLLVILPQLLCLLLLDLILLARMPCRLVG